MDTGTYTSNVAASYAPNAMPVGVTTAPPQIIGNPTPTVRTLPAKVLKTTLPPQYKTNTLPPKVIRVNLPPIGPVGGPVGAQPMAVNQSVGLAKPNVTENVTAYDVNGDGVPDAFVKNISYDYNGDGVPDRKVQVITGGPGLAAIPGGLNVDLNRDGMSDFNMSGAGGASTFVQPQAGAQYL